jgi:hypothetical protein
MKAVKLTPICVLCVLVAALFAAGSAQATASEWLIGGQTFSELSLEKESVSISGGTMTMTTSFFGIAIQCKKTEGSGTLSKGGLDEITLKLSSCEVPSMTKCKVSEPLTLNAKFEPLLTGDTYYDKVSPTGTVTITGEGCILPKEGKVGGSVAAQMSLDASVKQSLKFSKEISKTVNEQLEAEKAAPLKLTYGEFTVTLDGEFQMALSGEHGGDDWWGGLFTRLCKAEPTPADTCPGAQYWPTETTIKLEKQVTMKFFDGGLATKCTSSKFEGKTVIEGSAPLEGTWSVLDFTNCTNGCTVKVLGLPNVFHLETRSQEGLGRMDLLQLEIEIACPAQTCVYERFRTVFLFYPLATPEFETPDDKMNKVSGPAGCATYGYWEGEDTNSNAKYKVETPTPIFFSG